MCALRIAACILMPAPDAIIYRVEAGAGTRVVLSCGKSAEDAAELSALSCRDAAESEGWAPVLPVPHAPLGICDAGPPPLQLVSIPGRPLSCQITVLQKFSSLCSAIMDWASVPSS